MGDILELAENLEFAENGEFEDLIKNRGFDGK